MSFVKLQDGRGVYALDSLRLRNQREAVTAPQANTVELFMKSGILYQINENGVEQQIGIPVMTTAQRLTLDILGAIVYDKNLNKHFGYSSTGWQALY
ncbi:MAG: hypothetical protein EBR82_30390 [Caulobacteraceae bacterium]|nr:hypothetical protein [Caulobacteraceae bacterium]